MVTNPRETRKVATSTPADRGMLFVPAEVTTSDGLRLAGWFIPSSRRAAVMLVPGYKDSRSGVLGVAEVLNQAGFGVLVATLRAHDGNDGELITFGLHENRDLGAWYEYLRARHDVNPGRIGLFGVSMGGTIGIGFASDQPGIRAIVADGAFSSVADTAATSVRHFTGLPAFPFANGIVFWMERRIGGRASDLDATKWIGRLAPRAVLLMQGGADVVVSPDSGRRLFDAAGEPKELWFDPNLGHTEFLRRRPQEFDLRVIGFLERYLDTSSRF